MSMINNNEDIFLREVYTFYLQHTIKGRVFSFLADHFDIEKTEDGKSYIIKSKAKEEDKELI